MARAPRRRPAPVSFTAPTAAPTEPAPGSILPCVANFLSPFLQRSIPAAFAASLRTTGLSMNGPVSAGFFPMPSPAATGPGGVSFAVFEREKSWGKGATIRVGFVDSGGSFEDRVVTHVKLWEGAADVKFLFVSSGSARNADVRVTFARPNTFSSLVGREAAQFPNDASLSLGFTAGIAEDEVRRLVLHEFGHALGFHHEHQNPNNGIQYDMPKAVAYYKRLLPPMPDQQIIDQLKSIPSSSMYRMTQFDSDSIMLYQTPPEVVIPGTYRPEFGKNNTNLSDTDKAVAAEVYGGGTALPQTQALTVGGAFVTNQMTRPGEVDRYTFEITTPAIYQVEADGAAGVHIDVGDENFNVLPAFHGADPDAFPNTAVHMPLFLPARKYSLLVRASEFFPNARGQYRIRIVAL